MKIYGQRHKLHGHDVCDDIRKWQASVDTVFDVGANIGQTTTAFSEGFPEARFYCFEPVQSTYDLLNKNLSGVNAECFRVAMGAAPGQAPVYVTEHSLTNSLIRPPRVAESELVDITTVDRFAAEHRIDRISLLKIDTEGYDLEVLRGSSGMLADGRIDFVLVEVGFHPGDDRHVLFDDVRALLIPHGFAVLGIYDQTTEWSGEGRLRYANALFARGPEESRRIA